jgi:hypothetical protein
MRGPQAANSTTEGLQQHCSIVVPSVCGIVQVACISLLPPDIADTVVEYINIFWGGLQKQA